MNDDVDARLRDGLRGAPLPAAPEALRDYLAELGQQQSAAHRRRRARLWVALVPLAAVLVGVIALMGGSSLQPSPISSPPPSTASTSGTPTSPGSGFARPGFAFDPPSGWTDQTAAVSFPVMPEVRVVGYLVRGMTSCPVGYASLPPTPAGCEESPTRLGTATLAIVEMNDQYPWLPTTLGPETTMAGYPSVSTRGDAETDWFIQSPDGGIYHLTLNSPKDEMAANVAVVTQALDSLRLTTWEQAPTIVNGLIPEDPGQGFSFDYPADWVRYYPTDNSMTDRAVVTVASSPLLPPCHSDTGSQASGAPPVAPCGTFTTPPGTIAIAFRIGGGMTAPDWSKAKTTIGGQPAFDYGAWGPVNATSAEVGHSWGARLTDREVLGIDVSIRGPNIPALQAANDEVLQSLVITPRPSPTP